MIPNPWVILGAVVFLAFAITGAYWKGHSTGVTETTRSYEMALSKQKADAQKILADAETRARDAEAKSAELSAQIEKDHDNALAKINDQDRRITDLVVASGGLRVKAARCGIGGGDNVPGKTAVAGIPPISATGTECQLSAEISRQLQSDYRAAAVVTEFASRCLEYAVSCSRLVSTQAARP